MTRELSEHSIPAAESLLRARIQESTAVVLDALLFDDEPGNDVRPPGLLYDAAELPTADNFIGDLQQLIEGLAERTQSRIRAPVIIMNTAQALAATLGMTKDVLPTVSSASVPPGLVIMLDAADFVCAGGDAPRFEISREAAVHMEMDAPLPIDGASPVRSLWQTDTLGLRMILNVDWALRRPDAVTFMQEVFWQVGGGGVRPGPKPSYIKPVLNLTGD